MTFLLKIKNIIILLKLKRKSVEKIKNLEEETKKFEEERKKEREFLAAKSIDSSKERKKILDLNKKEILALRKVKKIKEEAENSEIVDDYQRNVKNQIYLKNIYFFCKI